MSSDEEWEREQIARGTQSRRHVSKDKLAKSSGIVDATIAKKRIYDDMEKIQAKIEIVKWNMGKTRLDLVKCCKNIESITGHIKQLELHNPLFEQIGALEDGQQVLEFLDRNKSVISNLPHDQKELISELADKARDDQQQMDIETN